MDHSRWMKLIKDVWWSGWMWVGECFCWYRPTRVVPDLQAVKRLYVGVCYCSKGKDKSYHIPFSKSTARCLSAIVRLWSLQYVPHGHLDSDSRPTFTFPGVVHQPSDPYQITLLGISNSRVWTTCPESLILRRFSTRKANINALSSAVIWCMFIQTMSAMMQ